MNASVFHGRIIPEFANKYKQIQKNTFRNLLLALSGLFIGVVNGVFGAGGGMLAVPALSFVAKLEDRRAHATAIAVILPLCLIASVVYSLRRSFDLSVALPTAAGVFAGGLLGALALKRISPSALSFIFYVLMLVSGLKMLL